MLFNTNGTNLTMKNEIMEQQSQPPMEIDSLEQIRQESVALRRELGLPGGALTDEQQKIYLDAKSKLWHGKEKHQEPARVATERK